MEPYTLIGLAVVAYLVTRPRQEGSPPAPRPDDEDLGRDMLLRGPVADLRQLAGGRAVPQGEYVEGMTIEAKQAEPFLVYFPRTRTRWTPMASGKHAPEWGAAGMPVADTNPAPPGAAPVPSSRQRRLELSYESDYPSGKPPRRRKDDGTGPGNGLVTESRWSGCVARGDEPRWRPISGREGAPDAAPRPDEPGGTVRRLRGIRTAGGDVLVAAADSVNWSALEANTLPEEKREEKSHRLYVGAGTWTVVEVSPRGAASISRAEAETRLSWVVPGTARRVDGGEKNDATLRKAIEGADGRPGGPVWQAPYFRAVMGLEPARGALAIDNEQRIHQLALDYPRAGAAAWMSGWREFALSSQNVVPSRVELVCTARSSEWDPARPHIFGDRCVGTTMMWTASTLPLFPNAGRRLDEPGEALGGPITWARGTASQYQSAEPMIPFALEAPLLMRKLVNKTYIRAIR